MEGLEISEVSLSYSKQAFDDFRIHSEAFSKAFLNAPLTNNLVTVSLQNIAEIADGDHARFPSTQQKEVRYLQARDINRNFLEVASETFVSATYFQKNQRSLISSETILMSIMGNVGDITITPKDFKPAMANRALAIIRNIKEISPQYLFAYLLTKQSFGQIERLKNGGRGGSMSLNNLIPKDS